MTTTSSYWPSSLVSQFPFWPPYPALFQEDSVPTSSSAVAPCEAQRPVPLSRRLEGMPPVAGKKDGRMDTLAKMCSVKECIRTADGAGVGKGNARWSFQGCLGGGRLGVGRAESLGQGTSGRWGGLVLRTPPHGSSHHPRTPPPPASPPLLPELRPRVPGAGKVRRGSLGSLHG